MKTPDFYEYLKKMAQSEPDPIKCQVALDVRQYMREHTFSKKHVLAFIERRRGEVVLEYREHYATLAQQLIRGDVSLTPREAAKDMITYSVLTDLASGRTEEQIIDYLQGLCLGHCAQEYWAQTGSSRIVNGKERRLQTWQIHIIDIDRVPCGQIFDLRPLVREIIQEQGIKQLSLWEMSA